MGETVENTVFFLAIEEHLIDSQNPFEPFFSARTPVFSNNLFFLLRSPHSYKIDILRLVQTIRIYLLIIVIVSDVYCDQSINEYLIKISLKEDHNGRIFEFYQHS